MTRDRHLFVPWLALATTCSALMWVVPGEETIPYHVAWIGVALAYGFDPWPLRRTLWAVACYTLLTGGVLVVRAYQGVIGWEETSEIPLMSVLVLLSVWHVRRRQLAMAELTRMGEQDRHRAGQRERLSRVTSHEMRTPLTIAVGYVDLLLERRLGDDVDDDLRVVEDELGRLGRSAERLLRMMELQAEAVRTPVDVNAFLEQVGRRWTPVAERRWVVESSVGTVEASLERLRACLDTLIENALRYTTTGDLVRLVGFERDGVAFVGVEDSGPGLGEHLVEAINRQDFQTTHQVTVSAPPGSGSQTGLGLGLVHEVASMRGGWVLAGRSAEGGARLLMALPLKVSFSSPDVPASEHLDEISVRLPAVSVPEVASSTRPVLSTPTQVGAGNGSRS
ncbi:MAG: HAMP domain-containing sensor histidine kinase [Nocardioidaceae bacterium]